MSSAEATGVVLDEEQLERFADLVAREFVYDHADFFQAQRVGDGPRPRLLFRWSEALAAGDPRSAGERSERAGKPVSTGPRRRRRAATEAASARLLPIAGVVPPSEPGEQAA